MGVPTVLIHVLGRGGHGKASLGMKLVHNWEQRLFPRGAGKPVLSGTRSLAHLERGSG